MFCAEDYRVRLGRTQRVDGTWTDWSGIYYDEVASNGFKPWVEEIVPVPELEVIQRLPPFADLFASSSGSNATTSPLNSNTGPSTSNTLTSVGPPALTPGYAVDHGHFMTEWTTQIAYDDNNNNNNDNGVTKDYLGGLNTLETIFAGPVDDYVGNFGVVIDIHPLSDDPILPPGAAPSFGNIFAAPDDSVNFNLPINTWSLPVQTDAVDNGCLSSHNTNASADFSDFNFATWEPSNMEQGGFDYRWVSDP